MRLNSALQPLHGANTCKVGSPHPRFVFNNDCGVASNSIINLVGNGRFFSLLNLGFSKIADLHQSDRDGGESFSEITYVCWPTTLGSTGISLYCWDSPANDTTYCTLLGKVCWQNFPIFIPGFIGQRCNVSA